MPICLEPNQRFPIVLDSDKDKPIATRPTFFVVSLSMREQLKLSAGMDAALSHESTEAIFDATCKLLDDYLVGPELHVAGLELRDDARRIRTVNRDRTENPPILQFQQTEARIDV